MSSWKSLSPCPQAANRCDGPRLGRFPRPPDHEQGHKRNVLMGVMALHHWLPDFERSSCFMKKHLSPCLRQFGIKGIATLVVFVWLVAFLPVWIPVVRAAADTTAWQNGHLVLDTAGVVQRSNVILQQHNLQPTQSMPLGNGVLGAAAWSANGLTVQLNRTDTFPDRKAVGQVVFSSLTSLTNASNYVGVLNLYDGM